MSTELKKRNIWDAIYTTLYYMPDQWCKEHIEKKLTKGKTFDEVTETAINVLGAKIKNHLPKKEKQNV